MDGMASGKYRTKMRETGGCVECAPPGRISQCELKTL
jgi:hypothetical protein